MTGETPVPPIPEPVRKQRCRRVSSTARARKISIGYRFDRRPISGIQVFDLWYTTDRGQHWTKAPQKGDAGPADGCRPRPGAGGTEATVGKLIFEATTQGLYGFIPVARNGVGIGDSDPKPGDQPKYWVMVDTDAAEGRRSRCSRARATTSRTSASNGRPTTRTWPTGR